jgi:hypothetical protein
MTRDQEARIAEILQQCEEYLADRADAWTDDERWQQNEENRLLHEVGAALDMLGYKKGGTR